MITKERNKLTKTKWSADSYWQCNSKTIAVLCISLFLFGIGEGMLLQVALGSSPWTVFAQGIVKQTGASIGTCTLLISLAVMLFWIPLKQKLGLGTILNALFIALGLELSTYIIAEPDSLLIRVLLALTGIFLVGAGSAFYLTCHMGAGPRDGLMVGIYEHTGWRIGVVRTLIEAVVCCIGWLLGGVVGFATLLFAFGVGWVLQFTLIFITQRFSPSR